VIAGITSRIVYHLWRTAPQPTTTVGFRSFETPRDFDEIGTVIEIMPDGTWFNIGKVSLPNGVQKDKAESLASYEANGSFAFDRKVLRALLSISPSAKGSSEGHVQIEVSDAVRDFADVPSNDMINSFLKSSPRPWSGNSTYFVVLEDIKCREIKYIVSRKLLAKGGLPGNLSESLSGSGFKVQGQTGETVTLVANFPDQKRAVFYKPYLITPTEFSQMGAMPARFRVQSSAAELPIEPVKGSDCTRLLQIIETGHSVRSREYVGPGKWIGDVPASKKFLSDCAEVLRTFNDPRAGSVDVEATQNDIKLLGDAINDTVDKILEPLYKERCGL